MYELVAQHLCQFAQYAEKEARETAKILLDDCQDTDVFFDSLHVLEVFSGDRKNQDVIIGKSRQKISFSSVYDTIAEQKKSESQITERKTEWSQRLDKVSGGGTGGAIRCRKCGDNQVTIQQKQTRSADEGMTVFCTCEQCGFQWRMS